MENLNERELIIMLQGGFERIMLQLTKIKIKIIFLFQILKFNFFMRRKRK